jgi:Mg2+-importing ATPase
MKITDSYRGLSDDEALAYLEKDGPNRIVLEHERTILRLIIQQFTSPAIVTLLITAVIYGALGNEHDSLILLAIIIPSAFLTFFQEFRAHQTIQKLRVRLTPQVTVRRGEIERLVPVEELVRGDVIFLTAGTIVPADLLLIQSELVEIDESLLTGESLPREKRVDHDRELFMGTHVIAGSGYARVIRTGSRTKYGELALRLLEKDPTTSFEIAVRKFGFLIARIILVLVIGIFFGNILLHRPIFESLLFSLALAVGLTPQMLPVIISVCLSRGANLMSRHKVLIKRLDVIEDFGSLDYLCTDKTGTLTTGELQFAGACDPEGSTSSSVHALAFQNAMLQSSSSNSIDNAIRESALNIALPRKLDEIPFSFARRCVSILTEEKQLITKGAFEEVLAKCSYVRIKGQIVPIDPQRQSLVSVAASKMANGFKTIAIATKFDVDKANAENERDLIYEGFVLINDPPKQDADEAVAQLREIGVEVLLITGDALETATAVARSVGIQDSLHLIGREIDALSDDELTFRIKNVRVFAQIDPIQKQRIVKLLRVQGATVGFLGDGINDTAALHEADVAISVESAIDVAKSASSVVLLEKELSVILDGIRLGRRTFQNTLKYIRITMSSSFGNVLSMAIASLFLPFLPMLPTQILILNFLSDLPALAISGDKVDDEELRSPSHWKLRDFGHFMFIFGVISSFFDIAIFLILINNLGLEPEEVRSLWFAGSLWTEVIAIFLLRTHFQFWKSRPSSGVIVIGIFTFLIGIAVPLLGIFDFFKLPKVALGPTILVLALVICYGALTEFVKLRLVRSKGRTPRS